MKIEREYIREVKVRKHSKKGKQYQEAEVHLTVSLPLSLAGKRVKIKVIVEPMDEDSSITVQEVKQENTSFRLDEESLFQLYKNAFKVLFGEDRVEPNVPIPVTYIYEKAKEAKLIPDYVTLEEFIKQVQYVCKFSKRLIYSIHPKYLDKPEIGATIELAY